MSRKLNGQMKARIMIDELQMIYFMDLEFMHSLACNHSARSAFSQILKVGGKPKLREKRKVQRDAVGVLQLTRTTLDRFFNPHKESWRKCRDLLHSVYGQGRWKTTSTGALVMFRSEKEVVQKTLPVRILGHSSQVDRVNGMIKNSPKVMKF